MLTCVSAYFPVKNKHDNKYLEWFENTLSINCPYVFFTNSKSVDIIKKYFGRNTELSKELQLYNLLVKEQFKSDARALDYIRSIKNSNSLLMNK